MGRSIGNDMTEVWDQSAWSAFERRTARAVTTAARPHIAWARAVRASRTILRTYSTSFFIVTRFLPPAKRGQVEVVYAAVRYPDEIVDTFPISPAQRLRLLDQWAENYEQGLKYATLQQAVAAGLNPFVAAFAQVARQRGIPFQHYHSFLEAMRLDVNPRPFLDLEDLVESYIYGSATVVGYFLAYVYGASRPDQFARALTASRDLGIALQLTNFLRDVPEDKRRGRVYLPQDMLRAEGIAEMNIADESSRRALKRVLRQLSNTAEQFYSNAESNLDAFSPDCRVAIQSCIQVYRQLNQRIGASTDGVLRRESVPLKEKFRVLPPSKYWRLPLAYLGAL
jgi:phytoene synthase